MSGGANAATATGIAAPIAGLARKHLGAVSQVESEDTVTIDMSPTTHAWMTQARCRGERPGVFFPSDGLGVETAQRACAGCPVRVECLEYALANRIDHGVWGGASERERLRILRRRRDCPMHAQQRESRPV